MSAPARHMLATSNSLQHRVAFATLPELVVVFEEQSAVLVTASAVPRQPALPAELDQTDMAFNLFI